MEIKQYLVDGNGKAAQIEWENGQRTPIPYYVEHSLRDFDGDTERYSLFLSGLTENYEQEKIGTLPGEPTRSMFPSEDIYQSRKRMWESEQIIERHRPVPPPPLLGKDGFPAGSMPDEHAMERIKLFQTARTWESKLFEARRSGDSNAEDRARTMIFWAEKDLEKIPESLFQTQARENVERGITDMVGVLFDPKSRKDDSFWKSERVQHDCLIALRDYNERVPGNFVLLPVEKGKGTKTYKEIRPGSVLSIDLGTEEKKKEFIRYVYEQGGDPHSFLHVRNLIPKDESKPTLQELEETPQNMDQKTFETFQATGKVFSEKLLGALSPREREVLNASGGITWPDRHLPSEEEEPEPEDHTVEEFEASLTPYPPAQ